SKETPNSQLYSNMIGDFGTAGYGYGLAIHENFYGYKLIHHSGSFIGASAWIAMLPEVKLGVIYLANKHPSPRILALSTLAMILGVDIENEFPLFRFRNHLEKLAGEYELFKGVAKMKIIPKEGLLYYQFKDWGINAPLIPTESKQSDLITFNYYCVTAVGGKDPVQFEIDNKGTIWMHHDRHKWKRVKDL
ncbi:MAG: serine hydrolase, partial [Candidatus Hodarchaeota archaeon]